MRFFLIGIVVLAGVLTASADSLCVVSYNVENLFHPDKDSITDDGEWTPDGERHWSFARYNRKVENIARVLTNIGEWSGVDVVGLQEIENAAVVKKLCYTLRRGEYGFVHYDSPDRRGIDVALIYKKSRIDTLSSKAISILIPRERLSQHSDLRTRDILYVSALVDKKDTIHFFVCHLPSQRGGAAESEWKRKAAKEILQGAIDSVYLAFRDPKIIVMGDFNGAPKEDIRGVKNQMIVESQNGTEPVERPNGTHKYQGRWTCLDHFYTSPSLDSLSRAEIYNAAWIQEPDEKYLDLKPKRTYNGFRYQKDGFSDHLPIVLTVSL